MLIEQNDVYHMITCKKTIRDAFSLPKACEKISCKAYADENESLVFDIDFNRKYISINAATLQQRHLATYQLLRIDITDNPNKKHVNPDGRILGPNHLHIYRDQYGTKWAYDLDDDNDVRQLADIFSLPTDTFVFERNFNGALGALVKICRLKLPANIQPLLF